MSIFSYKFKQPKIFSLRCLHCLFEMVEMKAFDVLKYQKLVLTTLGIYPTASQNGTTLFLTSFSSYCVLLVLICYAMMGSAFVLANLSELTTALRAVIFIIGVSQATAMFFCYGINVGQIRTVHIKLQEIIDGIVESM